jgi:predicted DNA binding CopG/RHH family protein
MERDKIVNIIMVIMFGIFLQIIFMFGEAKDNPNKTAVKFTKAYFTLDKSMSGHLCKALASSDEENIVEKFIQKTETEAAERGLSSDFMKSRLFNIETETISKTDKEITLKISADRIVAINPLYALVTKLFHLGKIHKVDDTITVIKEDGKWKVCGKPFSLL